MGCGNSKERVPPPQGGSAAAEGGIQQRGLPPTQPVPGASTAGAPPTSAQNVNQSRGVAVQPPPPSHPPAAVGHQAAGAHYAHRSPPPQQQGGAPAPIVERRLSARNATPRDTNAGRSRAGSVHGGVPPPPPPPHSHPVPHPNTADASMNNANNGTTLSQGGSPPKGLTFPQNLAAIPGSRPPPTASTTIDRSLGADSTGAAVTAAAPSSPVNPPPPNAVLQSASSPTRPAMGGVPAGLPPTAPPANAVTSSPPRSNSAQRRPNAIDTASGNNNTSNTTNNTTAGANTSADAADELRRLQLELVTARKALQQAREENIQLRESSQPRMGRFGVAEAGRPSANSRRDSLGNASSMTSYVNARDYGDEGIVSPTSHLSESGVLPAINGHMYGKTPYTHTHMYADERGNVVGEARHLDYDEGYEEEEDLLALDFGASSPIDKRGAEATSLASPNGRNGSFYGDRSGRSSYNATPTLHSQKRLSASPPRRSQSNANNAQHLSALEVLSEAPSPPHSSFARGKAEQRKLESMGDPKEVGSWAWWQKGGMRANSVAGGKQQEFSRDGAALTSDDPESIEKLRRLREALENQMDHDESPVTLDVSRCNIKLEGCYALSALLASDKVSHVAPVTTLDVSSNPIGDDGLGVILQAMTRRAQEAGGIVPMPLVKKLSLSNCNLTHGCGLYLALHLFFGDSCLFPNLEVLDLSYNHLTPDAFRTIMEAVTSLSGASKTIKIVDFTECHLAPLSFIYLEDSLKQLCERPTALERIILTGHRFGSDVDRLVASPLVPPKVTIETRVQIDDEVNNNTNNTAANASNSLNSIAASSPPSRPVINGMQQQGVQQVPSGRSSRSGSTRRERPPMPPTAPPPMPPPMPPTASSQSTEGVGGGANTPVHSASIPTSRPLYQSPPPPPAHMSPVAVSGGGNSNSNNTNNSAAVPLPPSQATVVVPSVAQLRPEHNSRERTPSRGTTPRHQTPLRGVGQTPQAMAAGSPVFGNTPNSYVAAPTMPASPPMPPPQQQQQQQQSRGLPPSMQQPLTPPPPPPSAADHPSSAHPHPPYTHPASIEQTVVSTTSTRTVVVSGGPPPRPMPPPTGPNSNASNPPVVGVGATTPLLQRAGAAPLPPPVSMPPSRPPPAAVAGAGGGVGSAAPGNAPLPPNAAARPPPLHPNPPHQAPLPYPPQKGPSVGGAVGRAPSPPSAPKVSVAPSAGGPPPPAPYAVNRGAVPPPPPPQHQQQQGAPQQPRPQFQ